jgi:hypothetical protein
MSKKDVVKTLASDVEEPKYLSRREEEMPNPS